MEWWNSSLILSLAFDVSPEFLMMHISIAVEKSVLVIGMGSSNFYSNCIFNRRYDDKAFSVCRRLAWLYSCFLSIIFCIKEWVIQGRWFLDLQVFLGILSLAASEIAFFKSCPVSFYVLAVKGLFKELLLMVKHDIFKLVQISFMLQRYTVVRCIQRKAAFTITIKSDGFVVRYPWDYL